MMRTFIKYRVLVSVIFYILWGSDFVANVLDLNKETTSFINWTTVVILFISWLFILMDMFKNYSPCIIYVIIYVGMQTFDW